MSCSWLKTFLFYAAAAGLVSLALWWLGWGPFEAPPRPRPAPPTPAQKAKARLDEATRLSDKARARRLNEVSRFFDRGRSGARPFAEEALSWGGKWSLVQAKLGLTDESEHARFLNEAFSRHVFTPEAIKPVLESAIKGYVADLEAIENEMLVRLRADLADGELKAESPRAFLHSEAAFREEYRRLSAQTVQALSADLGMTVAREITSLIAAEIATQVTLRVAQAAAVELGLEAGILGAGAASAPVTLGVGLVAAIVVDHLLDVALKAAGYDPAGKIARQVSSSLYGLERALVNGNRGLGKELERIHSGRARLRQGVVEKLLKKGDLK